MAKYRHKTTGAVLTVPDGADASHLVSFEKVGDRPKKAAKKAPKAAQGRKGE